MEQFAARLGEREKAGALFADVTQTSTLSETQYNYACFLESAGRPAVTPALRARSGPALPTR